MKKSGECKENLRSAQKVFRVMKMMCFLMFVLLMQVRGDVVAQNQIVSVNMKNCSVEEFLREIKEQTGIHFMYKSEYVKAIPRFDVYARERQVLSLLNDIFADKGIKCLYDNGVIVLTNEQQKEAEELVIKGSVKDERGQSLPGVTVLIKGTMIGVATDLKGEFMLATVKRDSLTLLFSFIGMKSQEVKWTGQKMLQVVLLDDSQNMEEVVITGYQVIDRRKSTSAISSVKMDDIMIPGVSTLDKMLEGQIPDLMVMTNSGESGVAPRIRIRGTSTLIGNREPLWVVDGVIVQDPVQISPDELNDPDYINRIGNAISGINPQDIERIDVLKDASATALYGTKAANGVIVITTKRGHVGEPQISYRGTATLKLRPRYSDRNIDLMSAKERLNASRELAEAGYQYATNVTWVGYEKLLQDLYNRTITYEDFEKQVAYLGNENTDWFKLLTRDAFSSSHTVSVTGGTEKIRYYSSVGVNIEEDVVEPNFDKRYTASLNLDMNFTPWLAASFNMNANTSKRKYYQEEISPINYAYNTSRAIPAYTEDEKYSFYQIPGGSYVYYNYNILNELENSSKKQESSTMMFRVNLDIKPWEWLKIGTMLSYSISNTDIEGYWGPNSFHAAKIRGSNYGDKLLGNTLMPKGGELTIQDIRNKSYMFRLQADLNKYWGSAQQHNINTFLGMEVNSSKYNAYQNVTRGYDPERGKQFVTVAPGTYPSYDEWVATNVPIVTDNLSNMLSLYGSISYSYENLFTINANVRYDGSNQFGERSNDKILPIWSTSVSYNIAEHGLCDWFDDLRLKVSYGYQGNMLDNQSPVMVISKKPEDDHYGEYVSTIDIYPNPALKWEKTGSLNLGVEFSILEHRLMVSAAYYRKKTTDAYMNKEISEVNGMKAYVVNGGEVVNSGYDISFMLIPVKTDDLRWYVSTSFSHANNEVSTLPSADQYERSNFLNGTAVVKGKSVSSFYSYKFVGLNQENGLPLFDDMEDEKEKLYGATKYDVFTQVLEASGQREPTIFGGFNTTVNYKRWRLNASFTYSLGAKTRLFKLYTDNSARIRPESNLSKTFLKRWQHQGDENYTNIPAFISNGRDESSLSHWSTNTSGQVPEIASTRWEMYNYSNIRVVSADYLKCTNLGLTYSFDAECWGISLLDVSVSVSNPFILTNRKLKGQTPIQSGFTEIQLSERQTFSLGLNMTF